MALQPSVGPWPLFQFLARFTQSVGLLGGGPARRTQDSTNTEKAHTDIHVFSGIRTDNISV
jgi:hypothetical protein